MQTTLRAAIQAGRVLRTIPEAEPRGQSTGQQTLHKEMAERGQHSDLGPESSADRSLGAGMQEEGQTGGEKSYEGPGCKVSFLGVPLFLITLLKS